MTWINSPFRSLDARRLLSLVLIGAFVWSLSSVDWRGGIVHTGGGDALKDFPLALFPPELSPGFLKLGLIASWQTVVHAVAGITLAIIIGLPLGVIASGSLGKPGRVRIRHHPDLRGGRTN